MAEDTMAAPKRIKPRREDLRPGEVLCEHCTAKCCRYFALPIETPTDKQDFDYIRWYLLHQQASIFVDDDTWYLLVHTPCRHLQANQMCGIYETRPQICRDYTTDACEYEDDWTYERYFETPEQMEEYVEAVLPPKRGASIRSRKPVGLPIL
jgi:Fe-S-cluster containining protein